MLDIYDEFRRLIEELDKRAMDYAVCGGMAMAFHGSPRATIDIDLLVPGKSLDAIIALAGELGYTIREKDLSFAAGVIEIRRVSKIDRESGDLLSLDFLLVTPQLQQIWDMRVVSQWQSRRLSVVSRDGLIAMKRLRGSGQDLDDIEKLKNG